MTAVPPVLELDNVAVSYGTHRVVHDVSFSIAAGEVVALVGESGSGKTTTAQAVIGLLPATGRLDHGAIRLNGTDIARWSQARLDSVRGARISLIPQDPGSSLNPVRTIGAQVAEILALHGVDRHEIPDRVLALLRRVGLPDPGLRVRQYPHELSGGMRQRVLIAIAIALDPALIIADEPTSALDVTVQRRILDLIDELRAGHDTAVLLVTHDLGIAADRASRLVIFQNGRIQEQGETAAILRAPRSAYARRLLADVPAFVTPAPRPPPRPPVPGRAAHAIAVEGLVRDFPVAGARGGVRAVDGVSFTVPWGTTLALVGESGSGKTTTVRCVVGFQQPGGGRILVDGTDISRLRGEALRQFRRKIQLVYQNPYTSLDPRQSVAAIIAEPLLNFGHPSAGERARRVAALAERVGLDHALLSRRPLALSGGQRQRVAIARALILEPQILVLDEAVSALDVTVQAQILALLETLQRDLGLTYLFISHDLAVVRRIADTVAVLYQGRLVEQGPVEQVFTAPANAATRELLDAIPGRHVAAPAILEDVPA
jgi:peptide/nickel transport system ATP-binding protein